MQHGCEEEGEEEVEEEGRKKEGEAEVASPIFLRDEFVGRLARLSSKLGDGRPTLFYQPLVSPFPDHCRPFPPQAVWRAV
jgi:hypothetical protein